MEFLTSIFVVVVVFHVERKNQAQKDCNGSSNNCELFVLRRKRFGFFPPLLIAVDDWKNYHILHIVFLNILNLTKAFHLVWQASVELQLHARGWVGTLKAEMPLWKRVGKKRGWVPADFREPVRRDPSGQGSLLVSEPQSLRSWTPSGGGPGLLISTTQPLHMGALVCCFLVEISGEKGSEQAKWPISCTPKNKNIPNKGLLYAISQFSPISFERQWS